MSSNTTTIVILGATGDLSQRKLLPALFNLERKGRLPQDLQVVGFARSEYPDQGFCDAMWSGVQELGDLKADKEEWDRFASKLHYVAGDLGVPEDFARLRKRLEELCAGGNAGNVLYYLSIAPHLYSMAVENLGAAGLATEDGGWRRLVIEKPFGYDLVSAQALNELVHRFFPEDSVYRIDHYLGKETVQNIMVFRFANAIFEPIWNRNYVDNVQITVAEDIDVADRAGYYDRSGVVRDMIQNHLLQILAMVAMEPPHVIDADALRNKKVEVLDSIRPLRARDVMEHTVRARYKGYLRKPGVAPDSTTATYAAFRLFVDNWRWRGVPFYLRTGKALKEKVSEVIIEFQCPPHLMFALAPGEEIRPNMLSMCLQPDEGVHLRFQTKEPDQGMAMRPVDMEFHYESDFMTQPIPEAYERLLQDAIEGDPSLFIRSDHIEQAWRIVDPILEVWKGDQAPPLHEYDPGSWGPDAADDFMAGDGRTWLRGCGVH